mmetsp:Transcript_1010/g.2225  ORF Transcript_1010/g.2225 Transcript_1010/m.2225 type:complete len:258 (+) Transcript_1010:1895-2668(+)
MYLPEVRPAEVMSSTPSVSLSPWKKIESLPTFLTETISALSTAVGLPNTSSTLSLSMCWLDLDASKEFVCRSMNTGLALYEAIILKASCTLESTEMSSECFMLSNISVTITRRVPTRRSFLSVSLDRGTISSASETESPSPLGMSWKAFSNTSAAKSDASLPVVIVDSISSAMWRFAIEDSESSGFILKVPSGAMSVVSLFIASALSSTVSCPKTSSASTPPAISYKLEDCRDFFAIDVNGSGIVFSHMHVLLAAMP